MPKDIKLLKKTDQGTLRTKCVPSITAVKNIGGYES